MHIECDSDDSNSSQIANKKHVNKNSKQNTNKKKKQPQQKKIEQQQQQQSNEQLNDNDDDDDLDENHSICSSKLYELNKSSKRWRSMYALRDSIRNLTSCVTTRSHIQQKFVYLFLIIYIYSFHKINHS